MGLELPALNEMRRKTNGVTAFAGYNHNRRIHDNEFYDMQNITSAELPVVAARQRRRKLRTLAKPNGLFAHDKLCWADGTDFYYDGKVVGQVSDCEKQFVRMGAYVLIFPDKLCYNTFTDEFTSLDAETTTQGDVQCALCKADGAPYADYVISDTAPEDPENGDLWMDTSVEPHTLRQYVTSMGMWQSVPTVYTRISAQGIGVGFKVYDGVEITGAENDELNGSFYLMACDTDYIVVVALITEAYTQTAQITVSRKAPDMDYLTECDNRIWGCSSQKHEIYACSLGDPTNWNQFMGLSTDSYAMTVGSAGDFTGACTHLGAILFFKEDCIHQLMGSKPANFTLSDTGCRGVTSGSAKSLKVVNETLFYKSGIDVCAYGAALPTGISSPLGGVAYENAVGGALGGRYYVCMQERGKPDSHHVFVYDTNMNVWVREDDADIRWFATLGNDLYFLDADGRLWSVNGEGDEYADDTAEMEKPIQWMLETGDIGIDAASNQYISRIQLLCECDMGTTVSVSIRYDSYGRWEEAFRASVMPRGSVVVPIVPKRCRTMKIRLTGTGGFRLYCLTEYIEAGSDVYR